MSSPAGPRRTGRILITGSSDGIGREAARQLISLGHPVVLHARDRRRAAEALEATPGAETALVCDLASIEQTRGMAEQANALGGFHAIAHNAGVGYREDRRITGDGLEHVFQVNVLAPYVLTALIHPPERLFYLSSGLHRHGSPDLSDVNWEARRWNGMQAYSDSKLFDVVLANAIARLWPAVYSNSMEPGWVRTKMGGAGAPGDVAEGADTLVWLAAGEDPATAVSGRYFERRRERRAHPAASDPALQDQLLEVCRQYSGVQLDAEARPGRRAAG
jgi:NAD(P)-dependent dehydrogenase (short-subunit alcohol dehydrogenase family)